jgi:membrane associated rhomboid family serine protease
VSSSPELLETVKSPTSSRLSSRDLAIRIVVILLGAMWVSELIDTVLDQRLNRYGVRPRSIEGLTGIAAAPFLHAGFSHLIANTVPFLVLGILCAVGGTARLLRVMLIVTVCSGICMWLLGGRGEVHIGASGVVFGLLGFLVARGLVERRFVPILISVVVAVLFGGLIVGVVPTSQGISWQGHLGGFLGGLLAAKTVPKQR